MCLGDAGCRFGNTVNDLLHGPSVPTIVSFDVEWRGASKPVKVRDTAAGYAGEFIQATAVATWSAVEAGFNFVADPGSSDVAMIGHERNGRFFQ